MRSEYLFLSYTRLLHKLKNEELTVDDIDRGLFFLSGIKRERVFDNALRVQAVFHRHEDVDVLHQEICMKLETAERDGAVVWSPPGIGVKHRELSKFLVAKGFPELVAPADHPPEITVQKVAELVHTGGISLKVIF